MNEDRMRAEVREVLAAAVAETQGIEARFDLAMPWVQEPGADDGYWVAVGLERWTDIPDALWRTFAFVSYVSDAAARPREHLLDVKLAGTGARSAAVLVAMVLTVIKADLAVRRPAAARPVSLLPGCVEYRQAAREWAGFRDE